MVNFIVKKKNILYGNQFGFRSNYSTDHALLSITDKIQRAIEGKNYSCGIFLDLSKAFDTVDHSILIKKLEHYGLRGTAKNWFLSYLSNRRQFVSVGGTNSDQLPISCGVPQGSVLGPLLFLLYINDFHNCSDVLDFHLFADDSNLFYNNKNLKTLESVLNIELTHIQTWLCANKLSINIDKSNFVMFHPPQKRMPFTMKFLIHDRPLNEKECIKYLGVMIDHTLRWKIHINYLSKKITRSLGLLSKIRYFVDFNTLINHQSLL